MGEFSLSNDLYKNNRPFITIKIPLLDFGVGSFCFSMLSLSFSFSFNSS